MIAVPKDVSFPATDNGIVLETRQEIDALAHHLLNDPTSVTIELPTSLYTELQTLATADHCTPLDIVARVVAQTLYQRRSWAEKWQALCDTIEQQGGLDVPDDEEAFFAHMRKIRQEIYDEEYAHLYDHLYR